uniref:Uncharacterized protein n=1 Tax=Ciona savignyi TaxID=51511 RepID=H2Y7N6_CIOSA
YKVCVYIGRFISLLEALTVTFRTKPCLSDGYVVLSTKSSAMSSYMYG